jgi:D-glycero-beta-D-manno-heptose 1-phosphate adenylyltransferase
MSQTLTRLQILQQKIIQDKTELQRRIARWRLLSNKIIFTNGCFDLIHPGHIHLLVEAASFGNILIVGLNTDESIRKIKKTHRPIQDENSRALIMASFEVVDGVILFNEETPKDLIEIIMPDVLVKGGDYKPEEVVGKEFAGKLEIIPTLKGFSTTAIEEKIKSL